MNIYGYKTTDIYGKVQNQTASVGLTDFTGDLKENGIDVATTATIGAYLPLAGGTMSGAISMNNHEITGISALRPNGTNFVAGNGAVPLGTSSVIIGDNAVAYDTFDQSVIIGANSYSHAINTTAVGYYGRTGDAHDTAIGSFSVTGTGGSNTAIGDSSTVFTTFTQSVAVGASSGVQGSRSVAVGRQASVNSDDTVVIGSNSSSFAAGANIFGSSLTNTIAGSVLIGASSNIRASTTTCDLGTTLLPFQNLYVNGSIIGTTKTSVANDLVTNAGTTVSGNIPTFSANKVIQDSGTALTSLLPKSGGTMTGAIAMGTNNITNIGTISGATNSRTADNIVSNAGGAAAAGNFASFTSTGGKVVQDSAYAPSNFSRSMASQSAFGTDQGTASTAEFTINQNLIGSLVFAANSTLTGSTIRSYFEFLVTTGAATTLTIRFKVNGTTQHTWTWSPASALTQQAAKLDHILQARTGANTSLTHFIWMLNGSTSIQSATSATWDKTLSNTISYTAQFSDTNGVLRINGFDCNASFMA